MAHYGVNASVPKTLIQHVIRWVAQTGTLGSETSATLMDVLGTEISPELVPSDPERNGALQSSEAKVGPYELQDFFLYYTLRFGYTPPRLAFLAFCAWHDRQAGAWPEGIEVHHEYDLAQIRGYLHTFIDRFFRLSQYKRSTLPNAPKVGSGGSLSPRGDWRAPSDGEPAPWLAALDLVPTGELAAARA
jgi:NAD+ synthase (glutamine-hydrolysing)